MKTRFGFVSNSSSASFTLITSQAAHHQAIQSLTDEQASLIERIAGCTRIGDQDIVIVACFHKDNGTTFNKIGAWKNLSNSPELHDFERSGDPNLSAAVYAYKDALGDNCVHGSVLC